MVLKDQYLNANEHQTLDDYEFEMIMAESFDPAVRDHGESSGIVHVAMKQSLGKETPVVSLASKLMLGATMPGGQVPDPADSATTTSTQDISITSPLMTYFPLLPKMETGTVASSVAESGRPT